VFYARNVLCDHTGRLPRMGSDHEMSRTFDDGDRGARYALAQKLIRALNRRMTGTAPQNQRRNFDGRKQITRDVEAIRTCPIQNVDCRRFDGVVANALRPSGESAGAAIEVDHLFNRGVLAGMKCGKIRPRHFSE